MAVKPSRHDEYREVVYSSARWAMLKEYRQKAIELMSVLEASH